MKPVAALGIRPYPWIDAQQRSLRVIVIILSATFFDLAIGLVTEISERVHSSSGCRRTAGETSSAV